MPVATIDRIVLEPIPFTERFLANFRVTFYGQELCPEGRFVGVLRRAPMEAVSSSKTVYRWQYKTHNNDSCIWDGRFTSERQAAEELIRAVYPKWNGGKPR